MSLILDDCLPTCPAGTDCRSVKFGAAICPKRLADPKRWNPVVIKTAARDKHLPAIPRPEGWTDQPPAPKRRVPDPEPAPVPGQPPPSWPTWNPHLADARRIKACPFWESGRLDPECNCQQNRCHAGKGKEGIVDLHDCRACLATNRRREMVVARYREDLDWLARVPTDYRVTVYSPTEAAVPAGVDLRVVPEDFARETGAYLRHIVDRYEDLADLTVFCQADPFDHAPDFLARLEPWYEVPTSLTTQYLATKPPAWIKALDRVETVHGFEVRYGDALGDHQDATRPGQHWFDERAWNHIFACPMPRPLWFGYGACWAVPREFIRHRPLGFWRWLQGELERSDWRRGSSRTDPPYNPWAAEGTWLFLWADPRKYPHRKEP